MTTKEANPVEQAPAEQTAADPTPVEGSLVELIHDEILGEAGGVSWVDMFTPRGAKINITSRASDPIKAIDNLFAAMEHAKAKYGLTTCMNRDYQMEKPAAPSAPAAPQAAAATPPAANPVQAAPPPAATNNTVPVSGGSVIATKMIFTPRTDGKVKIDFYAASHQYPDLTLISAPDRAVTALAEIGAFREDHFKVAAEYAINAEVIWVPSSKTNSKGNPFKDVTTIKAIR